MKRDINFGAQGLKLTNIIITGAHYPNDEMKFYYNDESNITMPFNVAEKDIHSHLTLTERIALQLRNFEVSHHPNAINTVDLYLKNVNVNDYAYHEVIQQVIYFALGTQDTPDQPSITRICWAGSDDELKATIKTILKDTIKNYDPEYTRLNHYEETHEIGKPVSSKQCLNYYNLKVSLQDIA